MLRGGAEVARQAHNLKVSGSIPLPATNYNFSQSPDWLFNVNSKRWIKLELSAAAHNPAFAGP